MVRSVIIGPSLLETMMPTVSSDVTDSLSQTRVTFSAKPAPLRHPPVLGPMPKGSQEYMYRKSAVSQYCDSLF